MKKLLKCESISLVLVLFFSAALMAESSSREKGVYSTTIESMDTLDWTAKAPGVWSAVIGRPEEVTYLSYAGAPSKISALRKMPAAAFPLDKQQIRGLIHNNLATARIPLEPQEKLYGLGLQFQGLNRRGHIYHLRTDHYKSGNERLHAPTPFYVSSNGYGIFFNSPHFISIYAGVGNRKDSPNFPVVRDRNTDRQWRSRPESDAVEASVRADGMEVLVFAGPTLLDVVRRYNLYCGGGCLPPKWGLGFWHRMRTKASDQEVLREALEFEKRDYPLDVIGLEPGWHSKSYPCTFEWNETLFPRPAAFLQKMSEEGIHINLWENPYVSPEAGIYQQIKPFCGSHTVWLGIVPDYTLPQARQILTEQHESEHIALGVSGYKIDEVDGYDFWLWPDHSVFPSGTSAEQMRQTYALQVQKMLFGMFRGRNQRTYSLVRASNAGASAYPFAIYTDHYDHHGFITALVNSSLAGILYTPEIRSARSSEEWLRRMQSVCFSHMTQLNGWSSNTKPWSFPEVENEVRDIIKLRIRLLPYIYTAFARYHFEGIPPIRPMLLEAGFLDKKDVTDQYMFGDCILVSPMFTGQKSRTVILPKGKWYDFYTGEAVGGGENITVRPPLSKIPLFVKDGGIVPMIPAVNRISQLPNDVPLEIRHYGRLPVSTLLYDDDGETFNYEKGQYCWLKLSAKAKPDGTLTGSVSKHRGSYRSAYQHFKWNFMTEK